jgi:uncharacterized protein (TIGR02569 family)
LVPLAVLAAFGLPPHATRLPGGAGRTVRSGDAVLKPVDNEDGAIWAAELFVHLEPRGFRIARPLRARDGRWVVDGWAAWQHLPGTDGPAGRWSDVLSAGRAFHAALRGFEEPDPVRRRTDPWARADRAAWGEEKMPELSPGVAQLARRLLSLRAPVRLSPQLIHGDLTGNVLFADGAPPAVIDFSPYWRPAAYADAIVAVDGLLWHGADRRLLTLAADGRAGFGQLLLRAALFRLLAHSELARDESRDPDADVARFASTVDLIVRRPARR